MGESGKAAGDGRANDNSKPQGAAKPSGAPEPNDTQRNEAGDNIIVHGDAHFGGKSGKGSDCGPDHGHGHGHDRDHYHHLRRYRIRACVRAALVASVISTSVLTSIAVVASPDKPPAPTPPVVTHPPVTPPTYPPSPPRHHSPPRATHRPVKWAVVHGGRTGFEAHPAGRNNDWSVQVELKNTSKRTAYYNEFRVEDWYGHAARIIGNNADIECPAGPLNGSAKGRTVACPATVGIAPGQTVYLNFNFRPKHPGCYRIEGFSNKAKHGVKTDAGFIVGNR
jgi:hypothetical protein